MNEQYAGQTKKSVFYFAVDMWKSHISQFSSLFLYKQSSNNAF